MNVKLYEVHRDMLKGQLKEAIKELQSILVKELTMDKGERDLIEEIAGLISYLSSCISIMETKIRRANRKKLEEEA